MYTFVLALHSWVRWVVLVAGAVTVVRAAARWNGPRDGSDDGKKVGLAFLISVDVQFLLGLLLYFVFSPLTKAAFANFGAAMHARVLRFWAVEHITLGVLAVAAVHVTRVLARKTDSLPKRFRRATIGFAIALVLILAQIPWPSLAYGRPLFRV